VKPRPGILIRCPAGTKHRHCQSGENPRAGSGGLLGRWRLQLPVVQLAQRRVAGDLGTDDRAGRRTDDKVGIGEVEAGIGEAG
jgi:hypothetical protein